MKKAIEDYIKKCDPSQRRNDGKVSIALLGKVPTPKFPFEIAAIDIIDPYITTPEEINISSHLLIICLSTLKPFLFQTNLLKHVLEYMPHKLLHSMELVQP